MIKAKVAKDKVIIWNRKKGKKIFESDSYGKMREDRLELALIEACFLLEKKKIKILLDDKNMKFDEFYDYCCKIDKRFAFRYIVYKDLRNKKLPTRTGFKFGCDFRVYEKGVKPLKRGPKSAREHTKWVVFVVPKDYTCSFAELSRAVRLAHNIRANMLWAVVNEDETIQYFSVTFFKP